MDIWLPGANHQEYDKSKFQALKLELLFWVKLFHKEIFLKILDDENPTDPYALMTLIPISEFNDLFLYFNQKCQKNLHAYL